MLEGGRFCELILGGSLLSREAAEEEATARLSPAEPRPLSFLVTLALRPSEAKKAPVLLVGVNGLKALYPLEDDDSVPLELPAYVLDLPGGLGLADTKEG